MTPSPRLFIFGLGYTGLHAAQYFKALGWHVSGTVRSAEKAEKLTDEHDITCHVFNGTHPLETRADLLDADCILISIPPHPSDEHSDPVLEHHLNDLKHPSHPPKWIGYLSSTGVYGHTDGEWVDENAPLKGTRVPARISADRAWQEAFAMEDLPVHIFRLPGIYGPGRSTLERALASKAPRIQVPGHVFSRIHVDDIISALELSMNSPAPGNIYNIADDQPSSGAEVSLFAHELLGKTPPALTPLDDALISEAGKRFYQECRRVKNDKAKKELGWTPKFPNYQAGLRSCLSHLSR